MPDKKNFLDNFILVEYNNLSYPEGYSAGIHEVAAHLDKESIITKGTYSLHTEYSYGKRTLSSTRIQKYPALMEANKDGVPQLWKSVDWANQFAEFLIELTATHPHPTVIEIHPPFNDYCSFEEFVERFNTFEKRIHTAYPDAIIVIENRAGSVYHGGRFLFGKAKEIAQLCELIKVRQMNLGIVLDFPQLLTAENIDPLKFKVEKYQIAIQQISIHRDLINGVHIWGKKKSSSGRWVAHSGNFDSYFDGNLATKNIFLSGIYEICSDNHRRFLVPEINSGSGDLESIMHYLQTFTCTV